MNRDHMDLGNIVFNEDYPELYGSVPSPAVGADIDSVRAAGSWSHSVGVGGVAGYECGRDIPRGVVHEYDYISLDLAYGEVKEEEVVEEEEERDEEELVEREVEEDRKSDGSELVKEDARRISSAAGSRTSVRMSPLFELQCRPPSRIESPVRKRRTTRSARCSSAFAITTSLALAALSLLLSLLVGFVLREPATVDGCSCNDAEQSARDDLLSAMDRLRRANERLEEELERLEKSRVSVEELRGNLSRFQEEVGALNQTIYDHAVQREKDQKGSPSQPQGVSSPLCERMNKSQSWRIHEKMNDSDCLRMCEQMNDSDCLRMCEQMNKSNCLSMCEIMNKTDCLRMCAIMNESDGWNMSESANGSSSHRMDSECAIHPLNATNSCLLGAYLLLGRQPLLENYPLLERYPLQERVSCCPLAVGSGSGEAAQGKHPSVMMCGMAVTQYHCRCIQPLN